MTTVDNVLFNTDVITILHDLHEELPDILNIIKDAGNNVMVQCPFHKDGQETKPSCGIHKGSGVYNCFTCHETGTLDEFISKCFHRDDWGIYGREWLRQHYQVVEIEERPEIELEYNRKHLKREHYSYVPEMVLAQYRYIHPYMYQRKLTDALIECFDIGYDKDTDTITFPVRDIYGNCLFVARRSVKGKYFNYPHGAEKPLYGVYELAKLPYHCDEIWVTESMFNCLTLWKHGIPAVALNGTGSKDQMKALAELPCRSIVLALDPDAAGIMGMNKLCNYLRDNSYKLIYTVKYTDSRDINDLSDEECEELIKTKHIKM